MIPRCSSFALSLDIKLIFFCRQKFFNRELVSAWVFSKFFFSFWKMIFEKVRTILWTIFFKFDNRFLSLVRSFLPTWTIRDAVFCSKHHHVFVKTSELVAPGKFNTSTPFDLDKTTCIWKFVQRHFIVSKLNTGCDYYLDNIYKILFYMLDLIAGFPLANFFIRREFFSSENNKN